MSLKDKLTSLFPEKPARTDQKLDDTFAATFFPEGSPRLAHMRRAAHMAERIARQCRLEAPEHEKLVTAALFHDVGYSEELKRTGFHPLDGAVFLAHYGADNEVIESVLWHSSTVHDITYKPEIEAIYRKLTPRPENSFLLRAVSLCDFRASPRGEAFSFRQRIHELEQRFGTGSIPPSIARSMLAASRSTLSDCIKSIREVHGSGLPWIFCDIDNTLVTPGTILDEENRTALHRYMEAGGRVSLITGKHLVSIREQLEEAELPGPHSGINGSIMLDKGEIKPIGPVLEKVEELEDILMNEGINYSTYCPDTIWTRCDLSEAELKTYTDVGEMLPVKGATPENEPVFKVLTFSHQSDRERCRFVRELARRKGLGCVRTAEHFLELCPEGHGKHSAAETIMRNHDWPDLHSISIGDSENDITMFGFTGYSVAVANAEPDVAAMADMIIPRCEENGVARLIDELLDSAMRDSEPAPEKWLMNE